MLLLISRLFPIIRLLKSPYSISQLTPAFSRYAEALEEEEETILSYTCNICAQEFPTEDDFLKHHIENNGKTYACCKCINKYRTINNLYSHLESHREMQENPQQQEQQQQQVVINYDGESGAIADNEQLLYILEDPQDVNEVVIEQPDNQDKPGHIVQLEHGYVKYNVVGGQTGDKLKGIITLTRPQKQMPFQLQPSTSKVVYNPPKPRPTRPTRKRHVVPDFSAADYKFITSSEEIEMPHYKCLRCEQIFINKFGFFRHIEKGKCYINFCDVCNATFTKNTDFYYHYLAEHTDRAICNFCFRTFMYEKNVKEHMLRHLDQFRHRCDECNKGFYTIREYRNHYKNRHMGVKYKCVVCGRSFGDEYYFRKHLLTHDVNNEQTEVETTVIEEKYE